MPSDHARGGPGAGDSHADGSVFRRKEGALWMEGVRLSQLLHGVRGATGTGGLPTPFYVYSQAQLQHDFARYADALAPRLPTSIVAFAVKANPSRTLLSLLCRWGAGATVVSAGELTHVVRVGFPASRILLHGNGKAAADIDAALAHDTLISIDSEFDLRHVRARAQACGRTARILLRVNPNIDPQVHPYISTGLLQSKFGMSEAAIERLRPSLLPPPIGRPAVVVHGLHCHLGSTLKSVQPVLDAARQIIPLALRLRDDGHPIDLLDLGGGLGIDYSHRSTVPVAPSPTDLIAGLAPLVSGAGLRLWLEPGRSIVARSGALVGRVLGVKGHGGGDAAGERSFLVTDASMAQLIRPALYGAYHHIELLEEPLPSAASQLRLYDIVGPICESGDFLGQGRLLPTPQEGDGLIVYDAGAYGAAMASRYNLQFLPAEYLVHGDDVTCIRRAESYDDFAHLFVEDPLPRTAHVTPGDPAAPGEPQRPGANEKR